MFPYKLPPRQETPLPPVPTLTQQLKQTSGTQAHVQVPLHAPPPKYVPRPPAAPGIGVELESSSGTFFTDFDRKAKPHTNDETFWKGRRLLEFDPGPGKDTEEETQDSQSTDRVIVAGEHRTAAGRLGHWALTLDTTSFLPDIDTEVQRFTAEFVVDGTQLKLTRGRNVLKEVGQEILDTVQAGKCKTSGQFTFDGETVTGTADLSKKTSFSIQITCACPLSVVYDILYTPSLLYPLDRKEQTHRDAWWYSDLSTNQPYDLDDMVKHLQEKLQDAKDPEERERLDQLCSAARRGQPLPGHKICTVHESDDEKIPIAFADLFLGSFSDKHDPKQSMPIMPRTSLKKIFTTLSWTQQADALHEIQRQKNQRILSPEVGDRNPVLFQDYLQELTDLHARMKPGSPPLTGGDYIPDPLGQHPEALGIGKLLDTTETDLDGHGELPIFEFRKIGSAALEDLPDVLGVLHDEMMDRLQAALPHTPKPDGGPQ